MNFISKIIFITLLNIFLTISSSSKASEFPNDWFGSWKGYVEVENVNGSVQFLEMKLKIEKTQNAEQYLFQIQYDGEGPREYYIFKQPDGRWLLDERNGIFIDYFASGNKLFAQFIVNGRSFYMNFKKENGLIVLESQSFGINPIRQTGSGQVPVYSMPWNSCQTALLEKLK